MERIIFGFLFFLVFFPVVTCPGSVYALTRVSGLTIIIIDVGQGLSELVILPNGKATLIDGGDNDHGNTVLAALHQHNLTRVESVVATHPHADHIGGLVTVLKNIAVGQVLDSGQLYTTSTFENFIDAIDSKNVPLRSVHDGDVINLDPAVSLGVLNPPLTLPVGTDNESDFNNNSVVIKLTYGNFTALFTGDMQKENEARLAANDNINVDVLVAGHHGSRTSSSMPFLKATSPDVVIISAGAGNPYGHPHPETLARISSAGVTHLLRTDLDGSIELTAKPDGTYTFETSNSHRIVSVPESEMMVPMFGVSISLIVAIALITRRGKSIGDY